MKIFIITLCAFILVMLVMAVGVIFGKHRIKGSCGGLGGCELCDSGDDQKNDDPPACKEPKQTTLSPTAEVNLPLK